MSVTVFSNVRETNVSEYSAVDGYWAALACPRDNMTVSI